MFTIGPCIEPYVSENCFIPKQPVEMARTAWSNEYDCMIGGTSNEGIGMGLDKERVQEMARSFENINYLAPSIDLGLDPDDPKAADYGKILKQVYYGCLTPSKTNLDAYFYYMNDHLFWHGIQRVVLSRAAASKKGKTYLYRFDIITDLNHLRKVGKNEDYPGSEHMADVFHLFTGDFAPLPAIESKEFENVKKTVAIWTNFAITGDPNCSEIGDDKWLPVESTNLPLKCLNIGTDNCKFIDLPETERLGVWNSIFKQAGVDLY